MRGKYIPLYPVGRVCQAVRAVHFLVCALSMFCRFFSSLQNVLNAKTFMGRYPFNSL